MAPPPPARIVHQDRARVEVAGGSAGYTHENYMAIAGAPASVSPREGVEALANRGADRRRRFAAARSRLPRPWLTLPESRKDTGRYDLLETRRWTRGPVPAGAHSPSPRSHRRSCCNDTPWRRNASRASACSRGRIAATTTWRRAPASSTASPPRATSSAATSRCSSARRRTTRAASSRSRGSSPTSRSICSSRRPRRWPPPPGRRRARRRSSSPRSSIRSSSSSCSRSRVRARGSPA